MNPRKLTPCIHHSFHPPYKKILFNVSLQHNDGLLADHIARAEGIPFSEASDQVREFAGTCLQMLKENKHVLVRGLGSLSMGQEGTVHFEQDMRVKIAFHFSYTPTILRTQHFNL